MFNKGMFNKEPEKIKVNEAETIIGPSVKVRGDFNSQGDIVIDGSFEGSLKTTNHLHVGDKAKVKASVEAKDGVIGGEVRGNIKIKGYLEVGPVAKIFGDIEATSLSVSRGAVINGKCTMTNEGEIPAKELPIKKLVKE